jgi:gluconolactonase
MSASSNKTDSIQTLVDPNESPRKVNQQSYVFTEGPSYDGKRKVYFVDNEQSWIITYDIPTNTLRTWATGTQGANGTAFLPSGELISCRSLARDVVLWGLDGTVKEVLAAEYEGVRFNAPNDLVVSRTGWIYFTDPDFEDCHSVPESVYSLSPQGVVRRIDEGIARPNGIVLTPDERVLIINGTTQRELIAYDVAGNGQVSNRRSFALVRDPDRQAYPGYPDKWFGCDGMAVDIAGHLYVTTGAGIQIFDHRGGFVGIIKVQQKPTNLCFGGKENRTLFITAQSSLYCMECKIPGVVWTVSHP